VLPITPRGSPAWSWPLHLDKRSVGGVETSRKDRRRVGDIEFRLLQGSHVCHMGLIQKDSLFAEHRHASDLHSILDDLYSATPEEKQLARL
jgi:hypothetical protein